MTWSATCRGIAVSLVTFGALCAGLAPRAAEAKWLKAESPLFIVYSDGPEDQLKEFSGQLLEFDAMLRSIAGTRTPPTPNKLTMYLVKGEDELRDIAPGISYGVAGFYRAGPQGTLAVGLRRSILPSSVILFHEYAHHFLHQYHHEAYPAWFTEGFAEYFSTALFSDDVITLGSPLAQRLAELKYQHNPSERRVKRGDFLQFSRMIRNQPVMLLHAQGWLTVHYFMSDTKRRAQMFAFLAAIDKGDEKEAAFAEAFGFPMSDFDRTMMNYINRNTFGGFRVPRKKEAAGLVTITPMPASADRLLLTHARLLAANEKRSGSLLRTVQREAAAFPDDQLAVETLALAEMKHGDFARADAALAKLETIAPEDANTPYLKALRFYYTGSDAWAQMRAPAGKAFSLDKNHYRALYLYALAVLATGETPTQNTLNVLLLAQSLAPQVTEIALDTAVALARVGRVPEAQILLNTVAANPHAGPDGRFARGLITDLANAQPLIQPLSMVPEQYLQAED